jgi:hypothetical protein
MDEPLTLTTVPQAVATARLKLAKPAPKTASSGRALAAAALAAFSALSLAAAVILGPGVERPSGSETPTVFANR